MAIHRFHPPVFRTPAEILALAKKQAQEQRDKKLAQKKRRAAKKRKL